MTDSNATKAASNGEPTDKCIPAQREHGMNRLREEECYQMTGLVTSCLSEAEHLIRKVNNKVYNRVLDYDGSKGTEPLDLAEAREILNEAYDCAALALAYIFSVSTHLREPDNTDDPWAKDSPF